MIDLQTILSIGFMVIWLLIIFKGQRLQTSSMLKSLETELLKLKYRRNKLKELGFKFFTTGTLQADFLITIRLNEAIEHVTILPTDLDPHNIVPKIKQVLEMNEKFYEDLIKELAPNKSKPERRNLESLAEVLSEIEMLYKIARHYFFIAKKMNDPIFAFQSNMIIKQVKQFYGFLKNTVFAVGNAIPIGDGAGPMVVQKLGRGYECKWKSVARDTIMAKAEIEGHTTYIIRAEGWGSTVGRVNDGLSKLLRDGYIDVLIMVDAALKGGGDESGQVVTGEGAAIGGIGVAKFEIENMAVKYNIPIYAVLVKESMAEALGYMTREIARGVGLATLKVLEIIKKQKDGTVIAVVGVGNTGGIA